jgi:hypothetical protein
MPDERPFKRKAGVPLNLTPGHHGRMRWLPRHGEPDCILEWFTQQGIKALAWTPLYTALVATLVLLVLLIEVPWLE